MTQSVRDDLEGDLVNAELWTPNISASAVNLENSMSFPDDTDDQYVKLIERHIQPKVVIENKSSKNATIMQARWPGLDGLKGPVLFGTGYYLKRAAVYGIPSLQQDIDIMKLKLSFGSSNEFIKSLYQSCNHSAANGKGFSPTTIKETQLLASCAYENHTKWGREALGMDSRFTSSMRRCAGLKPSSAKQTSIELTGIDRPGLLSEVSAVLGDLNCNVVSGDIWTHNTRAAAVMQVTDEYSGGPITDQERLSRIKQLLFAVLEGSNKCRDARIAFSYGVTHTERRLHQMMFADRDYERAFDDALDATQRLDLNVGQCSDKAYSVITIWCKDRPKLLFDTICTLTDMIKKEKRNPEKIGMAGFSKSCL